MSRSANTIRTLRLTEDTNTLINSISEICENSEIYVNGEVISGSILLRYPFECIAHSEYKEKKIEKLIILLLQLYEPKDKFGNPLTKNQVLKFVKEVFTK